MTSPELLTTPDLLTSSLLVGQRQIHSPRHHHHITTLPCHLERVKSPSWCMHPLQLRPTSSIPMDPSARSWAGPVFHWKWRPMAIGAKRTMIPSPGWHSTWLFTCPHTSQQLWLVHSIARAFLARELPPF